MKTVMLESYTKRASNKLKQHGKRWEILMEIPEGILLKSLGRTYQVGPKKFEHDLRFVKFEKGQEFGIIWNTLEDTNAQSQLVTNRDSK